MFDFSISMEYTLHLCTLRLKPIVLFFLLALLGFWWIATCSIRMWLLFKYYAMLTTKQCDYVIIPPSTMLKGDIETVSVCPTVYLSVRNESPLTTTIFYQSLSNVYSMFIPMKKFTICSFIKNGKTCCHGNHFSFHASIHTSLCLFLTWQLQGNFMSHFRNTFIKVQHHFCVTFWKFWQ